MFIIIGSFSYSDFVLLRGILKEIMVIFVDFPVNFTIRLLLRNFSVISSKIPPFRITHLAEKLSHPGVI
jgi:hypothetical protein